METTEAPPPQPNSSKAAWIVAGVATAVALVAAMIAVSAVMRADDKNVNASNFAPAGFNRPVAGTIQSIDGSSFTVKETRFQGQSATTRVDTNSKTTFRAMVKGAVSDLKVGDTVAVTGTLADNIFTASRISEANIGRGNVFSRAVDGGPGGARGGGPRSFGGPGGNGNARIGQITKIEGDTVTLSSPDGSSQEVKTTESTTVRVTKTIAFKNLRAGDAVRVIGTPNGNKVTATEVTKGADDGPLGA